MIKHENLLNWEGNGWVDIDFNELDVADLTELEAFISDEMTDIKGQLERYEAARLSGNSRPHSTNSAMYNADWYLKASTAYKRRATKLRMLQQVRKRKKHEYNEKQSETFLAQFYRVAARQLSEDVFDNIKLQVDRDAKLGSV